MGEIKFDIQNVVASARVSQSVDLLDIVDKFSGVEYNPKIFPGLVFRVKRPRSSILIFKSGRMVCTGTTSPEDALKAVERAGRLLVEAGVLEELPEARVENIVASGDLGVGIVDLEEALDLFDQCLYEPEQFPGLIISLENPKTTVLLFASGKFVCVGARTIKHIWESARLIREVLGYGERTSE